MTANDVMLWVVVAAVAFLIGQSRTNNGASVQKFWQTQADDNNNESDVLLAYRRWVLGFIVNSYTLDELHTLAFELGVQWDNVRGDTVTARARSLIFHCESSEMLERMLDALQMRRGK